MNTNEPQNTMKDTNDIFERIAVRAKDLSLSDKEKTALFRTIDARVKRGATSRVAGAGIARGTSRFNDIRWWSYLSTHYAQTVSFALLIFVVLGSGTSFAAQRSLPGEFLYAIKVGVNEQLHAAILSDIKKTFFETSRATERLNEAQELAAQGKLTDTLKAEIETNFDAHVAHVQKDAEAYKEKGQFSKALAVNEQLESALKKQEETKPLDPVIAEKVKTTLESSVVARLETENSIVTSPENTDDIRKVAQDRQVIVMNLISEVSKSAPQPAIEPENADTSSATAKALIVGNEPQASSANAPASGASFAPGTNPSTTKTNAKTNLTNASVKATAKKATVETEGEKQAREIQTLISQADALTKQGDAAFASGRFNEAFGLYRDAQRVATQVKLMLDVQTEKDSSDTVDEDFDDIKSL